MEAPGSLNRIGYDRRDWLRRCDADLSIPFLPNHVTCGHLHRNASWDNQTGTATESIGPADLGSLALRLKVALATCLARALPAAGTLGIVKITVRFDLVTSTAEAMADGQFGRCWLVRLKFERGVKGNGELGREPPDRVVRGHQCWGKLKAVTESPLR